MNERMKYDPRNSPGRFKSCQSALTTTRPCQLTSYVVFQPDHRTMAAFVLAMIVNNYRTGQVTIHSSSHEAVGMGNLPKCKF